MPKLRRLICVLFPFPFAMAACAINSVNAQMAGLGLGSVDLQEPGKAARNFNRAAGSPKAKKSIQKYHQNLMAGSRKRPRVPLTLVIPPTYISDDSNAEVSLRRPSQPEMTYMDAVDGICSPPMKRKTFQLLC